MPRTVISLGIGYIRAVIGVKLVHVHGELQVQYSSFDIILSLGTIYLVD
jgi:hypothetical protein